MLGLFGRRSIKSVTRNSSGNFFTELFTGVSSTGSMSDDVKLRMMLNNPALARVVNLECDLFSLAEVSRVDGESNDPLIKLLKNPNYFQTQRQFLWSYRFWTMMGSAYIKPNGTNLDSDYQQLYLLNPTKIEWSRNLLNKLDKMILSKANYNDVLNSQLKYKYNDNTSQLIRLGDLLVTHDLTNDFDNWFKGYSRINALWQMLFNAEETLQAKEINTKFTKKFIVSGNYDPTKNLESFASMEDIEKDDVKRKILSNEPVTPVKAKVDIQRFVNDIASLKLDDSYNETLSRVGAFFNTPQDILEAIKKGATYENQEKAVGRHIEYSQMPKAKDLLEKLCAYFDRDIDDYEITFNNNSFMQVFEKDKAITNMTNSRTLETLVRNGADANDVAKMLGIDLKFKSNEGAN